MTTFVKQLSTQMCCKPASFKPTSNYLTSRLATKVIQIKPFKAILFNKSNLATKTTYHIVTVDNNNNPHKTTNLPLSLF